MNPSQLIQTWERVRQGLLEVVGKFDQGDLVFQPFPGSFTVREIVLHIAQEEYGEIQYGVIREISAFPPPYDGRDYATVSSLLELLAGVHGRTISFLAGLSESDLAGQIEAGWGGTYLLGDMIWHVLEHEIHHRGELSLILGMLGRQGLDA